MEFSQSRRQRGAVLLIAMVFLLLTSIIAAASMDTSLLEQKMATSRELRELAFQTAEAAIEDVLNDLDYVGEAYEIGLTGSTAWPTETHSYAHDAALTASSEVRYLQNAPSEGYSVRKGAGRISTYYFEAHATGIREGTPIRSQHVQGFFVEGPAID
jgi:hypothetical protein